MTPEEIRTHVVAALTRVAPELRAGGGAGALALRRDAPLRDQVDLDSMDFLNFVVALHERLGIDIPEADYPRLSSLDAIAEYLEARLGHGTAAP
jgi:acyl carrier protein